MRKLLLPLIAAIALVLLFAGCGDHHHAIIVPDNPGTHNPGNPAGFSNASLLAGRTYVFTVHGVNFRKGTNFVVTGNFITDGGGNIIGGVQDSVDDGGNRTLNEAITGTYFVNQDGRGQAIIKTNSAVNSSSGQAIYRFVLQSPSGLEFPVVGKLFQIGTTSQNVRIDAVGTIELQTDPPATPNGPYIVRLDGEDSSFHTFGAVGRIVFSAPTISALSRLDENDGGIFSATQSATGTINNFSSGRAAATLFVNGAVHNFAVYFVSPSKLELISTDTNILLQGNAEFQSSFSVSIDAFAAAAPNQVFALAGFEPGGPRAEVGRLTLSVNGILLNGIEDIQNRTTGYSIVVLANSALTLTPGVGTNGRWTANLNGTTLVGWQITPEKSVVLTTNNNIVETGSMLVQTLGLHTIDVSGNFAEALSGANATGLFQTNLELIANMSLNGSGGMVGTFDSQDDIFGLNLDVPTSGSYSIDPTSGRSAGTIDASNINGVIPAGGLPVVYYAVDAKTIYFLPTTNGKIFLGTLTSQAP